MSSTLLSNRYQVLETLGAGGFGTTFLAEDTQMPSRRKCVIKQLKPIENNPEVYKLVQERFHREAAILESLGNVNGQIPQLYAYFYEDDKFYLIQEWIEGVTLSRQVYQQGPLSESEVQRILVSILPVLSYVHSRQIIHRDIKPDNIILRSHDQKPVLIDFGAVRETMGTMVNSEGKATSSIVIGTPGFMPSEQAAGRAIYSSDLYSLGLTMIYLLTGKAPQELEVDPRTGDVVWQQHVPGLNPALVDVLNRAIQYNPRDRYATADEMLRALQQSNLVVAEEDGIRDRYPLPSPEATPVPATVISPSGNVVAGSYEFDATANLATPYDSTSVGRDKPVPPEVPGWNWGAFLLPGLWCLNNQVWIGLIAWASAFTAGFAWLIMGGILGAKGNEWAWKSRSWRSLEAFKANQRSWAIAGVSTWGGLFGLIVLLAFIGSQIDEGVEGPGGLSGAATPESPASPEPFVAPQASPFLPPPPSAPTSSASLTNVWVCTLPEPESICDADRSQFPAKAPSILVSGDLDLSVPLGTSIDITWTYLGSDGTSPEQIDTISVTKTDASIDYVWTRLPAPESGTWPTGNYQVQFVIPTRNETVQKTFSIQ